MRAPESLPDDLSADDLSLDPPPHAAPADPPAQPQSGFDHSHAAHHLDHPHEAHHVVESQPTWDGFVEGFQLGLYRDAIVAGSIAAAVLALLGVFIVLRRAVFAAATVSQAAGLGVVVAFYAAIHLGVQPPPLLGALLFAALAAAMFAQWSGSKRIPEDALLGLGFLVASAGAIALGDKITQEAHEVAAILFGTAVVVKTSDVWLLAGVGAPVALTLLVTWRGLAFAGFDPDGARVQGLPVRALDLTFWCLAALTIAVCTRVLGALPAFAFSALPSLAAIVATRRLGVALLVAAGTGAASAAGGYVVAYFLELPVGATQALCCALALGVAAMVARIRD